MHGLFLFAWMLRKLTLLALLGMAGVFLIGPVLALLGVLISFAFIGLFFWLPVRVFVLGRPPDWRGMRQAGRKWGGRVWGPCRHLSGRFIGPVPEAIQRMRETGQFAKTLIRETGCGAMVGVLLGLLFNAPERMEPGPHAVAGFFLGALAGILVALVNRRSSRPGVDDNYHGGRCHPQAEC